MLYTLVKCLLMNRYKAYCLFFGFWILLIAWSLLVSSFIAHWPMVDLPQCCGPYLAHMAKKEGSFSCFSGCAVLTDVISLC